MRCSRRCKCPPAFPSPPWPSAKRAPPTPASSPPRLSPAKIPKFLPGSWNSKRRWPRVSKTETESSKARSKRADDIAAGISALKRGNVIVFPTETLYGLGADAFNRGAVEQLVQALSHPLTATSANPSDKEPARSVSEAQNYFAGKIDVFVEGGTLTSKTGSTVVEVIGDAIKIIREGEIRRSNLDEILKKDKIL